MDRVPHHLLTLWNPSYAADAMDEHLRRAPGLGGGGGGMRRGHRIGKGHMGRPSPMRALGRGNSNGIGANPGSGTPE
jgi:hypothetical protein